MTTPVDTSEDTNMMNVSLVQPDETSTEVPTPAADESFIANLNDIYSIAVRDANGNSYDLNQHRGSPMLIVNIASKCGFTSQYGALETLYQKHKGDGFVILGFPCNQFKSQAPGTAAEEALFCQRDYGVTFPIMEKVDVNGTHTHPFWKWLKTHKPGLLGIRYVKWNFEKFLVDGNGKVVSRYMSLTTPATIEGDLQKLYYIEGKST